MIGAHFLKINKLGFIYLIYHLSTYPKYSFICAGFFALFFSIFFLKVLTIIETLRPRSLSCILHRYLSSYFIGFFGFLFSACTVHNKSISNITMPPTAPENAGSNDDFRSFENTTIWFLGTINCIIVALIFSKGKPFRQPTYKNCE